MNTQQQAKHTSGPHGPVFAGTLAQEAIQCDCPDTGEMGCFLFTTQSHRNKGTRCSPVFKDLVDLFQWCKANGWESIPSSGYMGGYRYAGKDNPSATLNH